MHRIALALLTVMLATQGASATSIPTACEAAKQKAAGKLRQCLHITEEKLVTSGDPVAYAAAVTKCTSNFSDSWDRAEQKAIAQGASCTTTGDASDVQSSITAKVACLTSALGSGDTTCLTCGDGVIDPAVGEQCDLGTFGGATCASATGDSLDFGRLGCTADCRLDTSGCKHCPGQLVGGYCWLLAPENAPCDATCAIVGLAYDSATSFYAGATGSDANCAAVLNAFGIPGGPPNEQGFVGLGCYFNGPASARVRDIDPTTAGASALFTERACACK